MNNKRILITGGAGFIGSFLTDQLIGKGHFVRILDNLEDQVHQGKQPKYLNINSEFIKGDIADYDIFKAALREIDIVYHLAASVGVGQSNYEIKRYSDTNIGGMANLLDIIVKEKLPIKKILMTASMTSYGEGLYTCVQHGAVKSELRREEQLIKKDWNIYCPECNSKMTPVPTSENATTMNNSVYSLTKNVQESLLMLVGKMYKIPVSSFRCFNVYGPRQSLSNPYTGVSAIFISRLKNNNAPVIYEDGLQSRDFISVHDVVDVLDKAMTSKSINYQICNLGTGIPTSIKYIAIMLSSLLGKSIAPKVNGSFRVNDIRHCYADNKKVKELLNWEPKVSLDEGLRELILWSENEKAADKFDFAENELRKNNLT